MSRTKKSIIVSIGNVKAGLTDLGNELLASPIYKNNQESVQEISDLMNSAQYQARAGQFRESNKMLLEILGKLVDVLHGEK